MEKIINILTSFNILENAQLIVRFDEYKNYFFTIRKSNCIFNLNFLNSKVFENYKVDIHETLISDNIYYDIDIIEKF